MTPEQIAVMIYTLYAKRNKAGTETSDGDLFRMWTTVVHSLPQESQKNISELMDTWRNEQAALEAAHSERMWQEAVDKLHDERSQESFNKAVIALEKLYHDFENLTLKQACLAADEIQVAF